jgi:HK97 family phage major capsid protein
MRRSTQRFPGAAQHALSARDALQTRDPSTVPTRTTMENIPAVPETKAADVAGAFDEFMRSFEMYKEQNDARLDELGRRSLDPVTEEKVTKLGAALDANKRLLDELVLKSSRPALAGEERVLSAAEIEHGKAFDEYVRHGEVAELKRLEAKALSAGSGSDGGFLVPEETEHQITRRLAQVSVILGK